jgi:hypothetical protein
MAYGPIPYGMDTLYSRPRFCESRTEGVHGGIVSGRAVLTFITVGRDCSTSAVDSPFGTVRGLNHGCSVFHPRFRRFVMRGFAPHGFFAHPTQIYPIYPEASLLPLEYVQCSVRVSTVKFAQRKDLCVPFAELQTAPEAYTEIPRTLGMTDKCGLDSLVLVKHR